ncbi:MAG: hypothetical protein U5R31_03210 [Acidimicrobiia bacterium]|nr:hypothetical protein [Acidimicrobiia bacterium]
MTEALDALMTGGTPIFKFEGVGDKIVGQIEHVEQVQRTEFGTNKPLFWDDGSPRMQFVVHLATDLDDEGPDDDGKRRIFARSNMEKAVKGAIRESKATKDQVVGGTLAVVREADGEPPKPGLNAPKQFRAQFKPATGAADGLIDETPTSAPASQPEPQPAPGPATDLI